MKSMVGHTDPATEPHVSRWAERDARRRANSQLARDAAVARSRKPRASLAARVEAAKVVLAGKNATGALQTIQTTSPQDRDVYILAEQYGQARRGVLKLLGPPRNSVKEQYLAEVASLEPDEANEAEGVEE